MTKSQRLDAARARRLQPGEFTVRHDADARRLSRRSAARDVESHYFPCARAAAHVAVATLAVRSRTQTTRQGQPR